MSSRKCLSMRLIARRDILDHPACPIDHPVRVPGRKRLHLRCLQTNSNLRLAHPQGQERERQIPKRMFRREVESPMAVTQETAVIRVAFLDHQLRTGQIALNRMGRIPEG